MKKKSKIKTNFCNFKTTQEKCVLWYKREQEAYAIQDAWLQLELNQGRFVKGRKIGLTSKALQQTFKATEPPGDDEFGITSTVTGPSTAGP